MRISDWSSDVCSSDLLAQRTLSFIKKNLDGRLPHGERTDADHELLTLVTQAVATEFPATMQDFALSQAIDIWLRAVFACNAYIDTQAPWTLRKTDPQRMEAVLSTLYEAIGTLRSEEHTSELQSLMRISYAVFCLQKKQKQ